MIESLLEQVMKGGEKEGGEGKVIEERMGVCEWSEQHRIVLEGFQVGGFARGGEKGISVQPQCRAV